MLTMTKFICSFLIIIFCFSANAGGFTANTKITRLTAHDFGEVALIYLSSNVAYGPGCTKSNIVALKKDRVFFDEIWETAMLAFALQKPVWGWTHGGCYRVSNPGLGMPFITRLDLIR